MHPNSRLLAASGLALAALCASGAAAAEDFPSHTVTIVVPYNAGGGTDGTARALAKGLTQVWGQPVIVENVGGADGLIGTQKVARAKADGYTLVLSVPNLLLFKHLKEQGAFDAGAALTPVSLVAKYPVVVIASKKSGIRSVADLQKTCRDPAANCSWGSGEQFSWLAGQSVLDALGVGSSVTNVPYRGTGPVVNDVLGGHLTLGVGALAAPLPHYRSGGLAIVAGLAKKRDASTPEVPTLEESGVKGLSVGDPWYGLFAPKGVPPAVLQAWGTALKAVQKDTSVLGALDVVNAQPVFSSAAEFSAQVAADQKTFDALLEKHPLPKQQ
jgi:tripartite-type tricarboxylate transporter receptor subunit TctC